MNLLHAIMTLKRASLFLGLLSSFLGKEEMRLSMVGLEGAGKSTILHTFDLGESVTIIPVPGFVVEVFEYKNVHFTTWDIGGDHDIFRPMWNHYFDNTNGLIFVVDSSDRDKIEEAKDELFRILNEDALKDAALIVYANKQDLPNAMTVAEMTDKLNLHVIRNRNWYIQGCIATDGYGVFEGMDWLSNEIKKRKH